MHYSSVRKYLKPYRIVSQRKTTIVNAFASAIAPNDDYDEQRVREAVAALGQDPDRDLRCAYCGALAESWDHVHATVRGAEFSGHGHRLGNLLPCCKKCNSAKGNKEWRNFLAEGKLDASAQEATANRIEEYLARFSFQESVPENSPEYQKLQRIKAKILALCAEADQLAKLIRDKAI